jgi:SNF related kinase
MLQEVRLMKLVQHPYVVRLYEVIDTQTKLYLVLEFADGGDMYDYIMKHEGGLQEELARKYFRQIVTAIQVPRIKNSVLITDTWARIS